MAATAGPGRGCPAPTRSGSTATWLEAGGILHRTLAVTGYPREVGPGWLEPLLDHPGPIDVALHLDPVPPAVAAERLRRQLARLESTQPAGRRPRPPGRPPGRGGQRRTPRSWPAGSPAARGGCSGSGCTSPSAPATPAELAAETARVQGLLASLLLDAHPTTFRALQGWVSTLPLGLDRIRAAPDDGHRAPPRPPSRSPPPTSPSPPTAAGCCSAATRPPGGWCAGTGGPSPTTTRSSWPAPAPARATWPSWRRCAGSTRASRSWSSTPNDEYQRLADAVGGTTLRLGAPGVHLNPLDLGAEPDALTRRALFCHTLVPVLLGEPLTAAASAALDRAAVAAYTSRGITSDPRTHARPAPLLADLAHALDQDPDPAGPALAARLAPYVTGSFRGLFDQPTSTRPDGHLLVFSLRDLPEELKGGGDAAGPGRPLARPSATPPAAGGGWSWSTRPGP